MSVPRKVFRTELSEYQAVISMRNSEIQALKIALRIFLGADSRFQIAVGGNPIAVERMLNNARDLVSEVGKS